MLRTSVSGAQASGTMFLVSNWSLSACLQYDYRQDSICQGVNTPSKQGNRLILWVEIPILPSALSRIAPYPKSISQNQIAPQRTHIYQPSTFGSC